MGRQGGEKVREREEAVVENKKKRCEKKSMQLLTPGQFLQKHCENSVAMTFSS